MLKSKTLEQNPDYEKRLVESHHNDFDESARQSFEATGGYVFVTASASIDILFVDANVSCHSNRPKLPFAVTVDNQIIVFDELDCSPAFEDDGHGKTKEGSQDENQSNTIRERDTEEYQR